MRKGLETFMRHTGAGYRCVGVRPAAPLSVAELTGHVDFGLLGLV